MHTNQCFCNTHAVSNPSARSSLTCIGKISHAGLNVRPGETVDCVIGILDTNGQATFGQPNDYRPPAVVGGTNVSSLSQYTPTSINFTVIAPYMYGANFTILGLLQNGTAFSQGPLVFAVGKCKIIHIHAQGLCCIRSFIYIDCYL